MAGATGRFTSPPGLLLPVSAGGKSKIKPGYAAFLHWHQDALALTPAAATFADPSWLCPRSVRAKVAGSPGAIFATKEPIPGSSWSIKTLKRLPGFSSSLVRFIPVSLALAPAAGQL